MKRDMGMASSAENKIVGLAEMIRIRERLRSEGMRVVFTNGCFDILHIGHVRYLADASAAGDCLVVGLNTDASVRRIKGDRRPVNSQDRRAAVLAALACVDYIVLFGQPDPYNVISNLKPDVLAKGADWAEKDIVGADLVKENGGDVVRIPLTPGASTTELIRRIVELYGASPPTAEPS